MSKKNQLSPKKLFFWGTPKLAIPTLKKLHQLPDVKIVGIGVPPDKKVGRKQISTPCPIKILAQELKLPIFEINNKKDLIEIFETQKIDLGIVVAFGMIFPASVLSIPKFGVVNVHFSLLPKYRGASPVQTSILNGDMISGITFQRMVAGLDEGSILYQKDAETGGKSTSEVFAEFADMSADMMPVFLPRYFDEKIKPIPQEEFKATYCGKFTKADGEIFPDRQNATEIYRKYLAFDIFPGIYLATSKGNVKLTQISLFSQDGYPIRCADHTSIFVVRAQVPGKQEMDIEDILRGNPRLFA